MSDAGAATLNNGLTLTDGDLTVANGHGVNFAATSDASGQSAELLDDYEEGTWTPTLANFTTSGTVVTAGRYVKIGRIVNIMCHIRAGTSIAFGLSCLVGGCPFAGATVTDETSSRTAGVAVGGNTTSDTPSSNHSPAVHVDSPNSRAFFGSFTTSGADEKIFMNAFYMTT